MFVLIFQVNFFSDDRTLAIYLLLFMLNMRTKICFRDNIKPYCQVMTMRDFDTNIYGLII